MSAIRELRQHYLAGRLLPFIGAGVSMSVTWTDPATGKECRGLSWDELVDQAALQLGFDARLIRMRGDSLQILEYYRIKQHGLGSLVNWLMREMRAPDDAISKSPIHQSLAALDRCRTLYTTNYDDYLERALRLRGRGVRRIALEAHLGLPREPCDVVKFHGDFDWPEDMVVSESDYLTRLAFNSPMDWRLRSDVLGHAVLFLGYSFRDSNVAYLFHLVNHLFRFLPNSGDGRRAYILVPDPSDFERVLFRQRNIEVVPVSYKNLAEDTRRVLSEIGA